MEKENYSKLLTRLSKIEGQVRGVKAMIESGREVTEIIPQLSAIKSGINQIALELVFDSSLQEHEKENVKKALSNYM